MIGDNKELESSQHYDPQAGEYIDSTLELFRFSSSVIDIYSRELALYGHTSNLEMMERNLKQAFDGHVGERVIGQFAEDKSYKSGIELTLLVKVPRDRLLEQYMINMKLHEKKNEIGTYSYIERENYLQVKAHGKRFLVKEDSLVIPVSFDICSDDRPRLNLFAYTGLTMYLEQKGIKIE